MPVETIAMIIEMGAILVAIVFFFFQVKQNSALLLQGQQVLQTNLRELSQQIAESERRATEQHTQLLVAAERLHAKMDSNRDG